MNPEEVEEPGFAPHDLADGRKAGEWQTRYNVVARRTIRNEALYLGLWLAFSLVFLILTVLEVPQHWLSLTGNTLQQFNRCISAWLAGTLGGTAFALKWLYHAVAHHTWNIDRRLWRFFIPHISGVLGLLIVFIVASGLFGFFNPDAVNKLTFIIALAFLTGYFSDLAFAKLAEIATSIFGTTKSHSKKRSQGKK